MSKPDDEQQNPIREQSKLNLDTWSALTDEMRDRARALRENAPAIDNADFLVLAEQAVAQTLDTWGAPDPEWDRLVPQGTIAPDANADIAFLVRSDTREFKPAVHIPGLTDGPLVYSYVDRTQTDGDILLRLLQERVDAGQAIPLTTVRSAPGFKLHILTRAQSYVLRIHQWRLNNRVGYDAFIRTLGYSKADFRSLMRLTTASQRTVELRACLEQILPPSQSPDANTTGATRKRS